MSWISSTWAGRASPSTSDPRPGPSPSVLSTRGAPMSELQGPRQATVMATSCSRRGTRAGRRGRSRRTAVSAPRWLGGANARSVATAGDSITVAAWTIVSRVTGVAEVRRSSARYSAPTFFGNTYQFTNSLPNLVYYGFLAGSLFSSLLVPALVRHIDAGDRAASRTGGGRLPRHDAGGAGGDRPGGDRPRPAGAAVRGARAARTAPGGGTGRGRAAADHHVHPADLLLRRRRHRHRGDELTPALRPGSGRPGGGEPRARSPCSWPRR